MLVKNSFQFDARVRREAETLIDAGHEVTVVAVQSPGVTQRHEHLGDLEVRRVERLYGRFARLGGPSTVAPGLEEGRALPAEGALRAVVAWVGPLVAPVLRTLNAWTLNARMTVLAENLRPDVVHAHDLNTLVAGCLVKRLTGAALVYDAHELHSHRNDMGAVRRTWGALQERICLRYVDEVVTATASWADFLRGKYGIARPTVVRNVPAVKGQVRRRDLRAALDISLTDRILLYQGSVQRGRGLDPALAALPLVPRAVLVVIGYGAHRPALEREAARRGLRDRVRFVGPIPNEELLSWTAGADIGLCCIENTSLSYFWSLPNKLFEYMSARVAVVASDFPEMAQIVQGEDVGTVCDPGDHRSIAAAINELLDAPARRRGCAERGAAAVLARHHWGQERWRLNDVYERIGEGGGRAATLTRRSTPQGSGSS